MSRRILLADDSVTIQKVIELTFMDDDYEVRAVGNGDEALAMLSALQVDFVIADVHMPGASGYEVCRRSKQLQPHVPVLLLVGTFEPFDEAQARDCGASSFLKKPFDSQELLGRVHELLTPAAAPDSPLPQSAASPATPEPPAPTATVHGAPPAFSPDVDAPLAPMAPIGAAASTPPLPSLSAVPDFHATPAADAPPLISPPSSPPPPPASAWHVASAAADAAGTAAPAHSAGAGAGAPAVDAALDTGGGWQEFELEAEPEFIPEPWQPPRTPPAAVPTPPTPPITATPFEQPFALGDLEDEPEPFAAPPPAALPAGFEPPSASPAAAADVALPTSHQPFVLGDALEDRMPPAAAAPADGNGHPAAGSLLAELPPLPPLEEPPAPTPFPAHPEPSAHPAAPAAPEITAVHAPSDSSAPSAPPAVSAASDAAGAAPAPAAVPSAAPVPAPAGLSDGDVDRIARRVVELMGDSVVRDVAWEVIPDLAEVVIKDRLRELESQVE